MKKKSIGLMLLTLLCFWSCSESGDGIDPSAVLQIYGRQYNLASGVIWENNPKMVVLSVPYVYEDTYMKNGQEVTDRISGFTAGTEREEVGDFMLSLYEDGLVFNQELKETKGRAACICFHFISPETDRLTPGKYVYGRENRKSTFIAYSSSDYDTQTSVISAEIKEGEVVVEEKNGVYRVVFNCKTSFGGEVSGEYNGTLQKCRVARQATAAFENISLAGLLDSVVTKIVPLYGGATKITTDLDKKNGAAFFSLQTGLTKFAQDDGKEMIDIALSWDKTAQAFCFESPIRMRSLLGHQNDFNFPCHTIYMKAPDSFTDADFEKLDDTGILFDIHEEKVEIGISSFEPGYVFFETGNCALGVMRVKRFTPMGEKEKVGIVSITTTPVNPTLVIDIKCPTSFVNPTIR